MDQPTATPHTPPDPDQQAFEQLGSSVLADLIDTSPVGIGVLDANRRWLFVNPAGCAVLGQELDELVGREAAFVPPAAIDRSTTRADAPQPVSGWLQVREFPLIDVDTPRGRIAVEYTSSKIDDGGGPRTAVFFRDVTEARQQADWLAAFTQAAASLAYGGSLQQVLDRVAAYVVEPTGGVACAIVLLDPRTRAFTMAGTAGHRPDYLERLEECRRLGAPLATLDAYVTRKPAIRVDINRWADDPRYEPVRELLLDAAWRSTAVVPLVARDVGLGVLSVFYPEGHDPTDADVSFLTLMADQVAVAVDNAQLRADLEGKAALEERHRLARELHDSVSQALFSMNLHARAVEMAVQDSDGEPDARVARGVSQLRELVQGALAEMRALIFQLRPEALHEEGLCAAIRKHAAAVAAREGLDVRVHADEERLPLEEVAEEELFRVVQEAVHNSVKHAQPHHVDISLEEPPGEPGTLVVEVADDGVGFEPAAPHPGHIGLDTMRERTERLGGRLQLESSSKGSRVRAVLPGILRGDEATGEVRP